MFKKNCSHGIISFPERITYSKIFRNAQLQRNIISKLRPKTESLSRFYMIVTLFFPDLKIKTVLTQCTIKLLHTVLCNVKFKFSKKTTKIDEIFTVDLTLCSKHQIDSEDFVSFLLPSQKT